MNTMKNPFIEKSLQKHYTFLEWQLYWTVCENIRAIEDYTHHYAKKLSWKTKSTRAYLCHLSQTKATYILDLKSLRTSSIKHYQYVKLRGDPLFVSDNTACVGQKFDSEFFNNLKNFPDKGFPAFLIDLPHKYKEVYNRQPISQTPRARESLGRERF